MVWLPVFGIVNVRTGVDACHCTQGLYGHRKGVCTGSGLEKKWKKKKIPHRGLEPATVCTAVWGCQYREHEAREDLGQIRAIFILHLTSGFSGFIQTLLLANCDVSGLESCKFQQKVSLGT